MNEFEKWWEKHKWDRPYHKDAAMDAWKAALKWVIATISDPAHSDSNITGEINEELESLGE